MYDEQEIGEELDIGREDAEMLLGRDEILKRDDIEYEIVDVPEWGGKVRVRTLTGDERDRYEGSLLKGKGNKVDMRSARAKLVAMACVDMKGERVFSGSDVAKLTVKSAAALGRVFQVAARMSALTPEAMEELVGNSVDDLFVVT